jgi:hypothetical protein
MNGGAKRKKEIEMRKMERKGRTRIEGEGRK